MSPILNETYSIQLSLPALKTKENNKGFLFSESCTSYPFKTVTGQDPTLPFTSLPDPNEIHPNATSHHQLTAFTDTATPIIPSRLSLTAKLLPGLFASRPQS
jgi:hypothetical protein